MSKQNFISIKNNIDHIAEQLEFIGNTLENSRTLFVLDDYNSAMNNLELAMRQLAQLQGNPAPEFDSP